MTPDTRPTRGKAETLTPTPLSPDEVTQQAEVRQFIGVLIAALVVGGVVGAVAAALVGTPRWVAVAILLWGLAVWLAAFARRALGSWSVEAVVFRVGVVLLSVITAIAFAQPSMAIAMVTALLVPIAAALPYLEVRSLRRLLTMASLATIATIAASRLPEDPAESAAVTGIVRLLALAIIMGVVTFLLYQSSARLRSSGREFRRLFQLSSDLAETTEPAVLGELVARHLAEATGFDDCVIYALAPETGRLAPFGSHPVERALETEPESLAERPMLGRVIHDRERIMIDVSEQRVDPAERARLRAVGRDVMLLLPLVALSEPVGVAELTASGHRPLDERRLALARTLAFEAAMAIENGRLYHELRRQALHDPLTGLANRSLFDDRLEHAVTRLLRHEGGRIAVLYMDLDDFKTVNDTLGHARGDALLVLVAERLRTVVRPADTVARLGGDEFALLLEELDANDAALVVAKRAIDAIAAPFQLAGQQVSTSISVGVAVHSGDGASVDEIVHEADAAMYEAKRIGKRQAVQFSPGLVRPAAVAAVPEAIGGDALALTSPTADGSAAAPSDRPR